MGPYEFSLALGATGLAVMALLGFGHHGTSHGGHHVVHHGSHPVPGGPVGHGAGHDAMHHGGSHRPRDMDPVRSLI